MSANPIRNETNSDARSQHFDDAADRALNDRFAQSIRNRVRDRQNLTFPEPPGDD